MKENEPRRQRPKSYAAASLLQNFRDCLTRVYYGTARMYPLLVSVPQHGTKRGWDAKHSRIAPTITSFEWKSLIYETKYESLPFHAFRPVSRPRKKKERWNKGSNRQPSRKHSRKTNNRSPLRSLARTLFTVTHREIHTIIPEHIYKISKYSYVETVGRTRRSNKEGTQASTKRTPEKVSISHSLNDCRLLIIR